MTDSPSPRRPGSRRLEGRIALVTGASRGIGAAVARRYAAEGARLILAARTVGALEEVDDAIRAEGAEKALLVPMDLSKHDQIDLLGRSIYERYGRLDVVVGNAGQLGALGPIAYSAAKMWNTVMDVNLTANYRLIRSVDALLRASDSGRAIFVTSGVARATIPYFGPYAISKAGLEMMVKLYAVETEKTNVRVNMIDPGIVRTKMRALGFPGEDASQHPPPEAVTEAFVRLAEPSFDESGTIVDGRA